MKVILNIEAVTYPLTGIGRYVYEIGQALARSGCLESLMLMFSTGARSALPEEPAALARSSLASRLLWRFKVVLNAWPMVAYALNGLKLRLLALDLKKYPDYLYHGPNYYLLPEPGLMVATIRASLPEVMGEAAPLLDALDVAAWREAIRQGLEDRQWHQSAGEAGLSQASRFSWDRCAAETLAVYTEPVRLR